MNLLFKALNDDTRRKILEILHRSELSAGEIAEHFHMTKPSISHHLDLLKQANLIEADRRGQFIVYSLNTTVVDELLVWLMKLSDKKQHKPILHTSKHAGHDKNA